MSILSFLVPIVVAAIATIVRAAITRDWQVRSLFGMFFYALLILVLPLFIKP